MKQPDLDFQFPLLWTIGFAGKRYLPDEEKVAAALAKALSDLKAKAGEAGAELTAISSLARGGDILFAGACLERGIHWRGLIPFEWEDFLRLDLPPNDPRGPLSEPERNQRMEEARRLRHLSFGAAPKPEADEPLDGAMNVFPDPMVVTLGVVVQDNESRETAYQDCSYRIVDESDVMILLLSGEEFRAVTNAIGGTNAEAGYLKAGTRASAHYAYAARKPCIFLNAEADDPWESREVRRKTIKPSEQIKWFVDPVVTGVVKRAVKAAVPMDKVNDPGDAWKSEKRMQVCELGRRLGGLAGHHQRRTQNGLSFILLLHLIATCLAAASATLLADWRMWWWWMPLAALAFFKSLLILWAWGKERVLHREHRDLWLHARVLAEFCRSAIAMWPLPLQPLDAADEEDFPRLKRLIRTLRLMRAMDPEAAVRGSSRQPSETSLEANMRAACEIYIQGRLEDQEQYYGKHAPRHKTVEKFWRRWFQIALWIAIAAGLALGVVFINHRQPAPHGEAIWWIEKSLEAVLITAPFAAAYFLGMITIRDSRRRSARYGEMKYYLERLADTLRHCASNPSRLRLIEHAERMLIEEQHEWFSVTRNTNV